MNQLTNEEKNYIVKEYGASIEIIEKIERIINGIKIEETDYMELIIEIVSEYETNELKKTFGSDNLYSNLKEIIKDVLKFKYNFTYQKIKKI